MKRCWLHIGMHKTSSTSVQHNLRRIDAGLKWRILRVGGRANMGPALHAMFLADSGKCKSMMKRGFTPEQIEAQGKIWRKKLRRTIRNYKGEVCIISGESLTDAAFCEESVNSLRDFLKPLFDEVTVIGYVRPPCQYKNSRFQERIKHGQQNQFYPERVSYRTKFEKFDRAFGQSNVKLRKFDPTTFPNKCAVADFCQQIGIQLPQGSDIQRLNESLSRSACGILYAYRIFGPGFGKGKGAITENACLVRVLQMMGGEKLAFSASILHASLDNEKADVAWMEERLGHSLDEEYSDKGGELKSREELLTISQSSCLDFIRCFEKMHELCLMPNLYPQGDPVNPVDIASLLENCRAIIRQLLSQNDVKPSKVRRRDGVILHRLIRIPAILKRNYSKYFKSWS